jgi:hypothetical protein
VGFHSSDSRLVCRSGRFVFVVLAGVGQHDNGCVSSKLEFLVERYGAVGSHGAGIFSAVGFGNGTGIDAYIGLDCQVAIELYLPIDVDIRYAKKIAYEAAATSRFVYLNKPIVVMVQDMYDKGFLTKLKVKAYVLDTRYEFAFASDVSERAKAAFVDAGFYGLKEITI